MIRGRIVLGLVVAVALFRSPDKLALQVETLAFQASGGQHMPCDQAASLLLPDVKITEATPVAAATTGAIRAAHCRVAGVIGTEIKFSLLLPDAWNGKFMMGGGGGYVGTVQNQAAASVNAGYATAGTDTGHQGGLTDASWAVDNMERFVNFGYLAIHRTTEVSKAIVRSYYGSASTRAYFSGCSNGGRQALMEAQRFPDDFDGIVAGAPAADFVGIAAQFIKDMQAVFPSQATTPMFTADVLKSVEAQIVEKCDAIDGVKDGLMEDPRRCKVDIAALTGLSDAQRAALKQVYAETSGKEGVVYPAQPVGGEGEGAGWAAWITGGGQSTPQGPSLRYGFGTQFFKYFVFNDPSWDYHKYDIANSRNDARMAASVLNATNPDLSAFKAKGRKLIVWHGWSDPALTALGSIRYYEQVQGRDAAVRDYFRLFMMPGVLHCAGGPGPDNADWTAAIADWVENGKAPDTIVARKLGAGGAATRSRPLCPYPLRARYVGSGSIDDAANFACRAEQGS
jgi:tannase/feruloyl esterase